MMNPLGMILANFYPFLFLQVEGTTYKKQQIQIFNYLSSYMLMTFLWFILAISSFFQKNQRFDDDTPEEQSVWEANQELELELEQFDRVDFMTQVRILMKDRSYLAMLFAAGFTYGCFTGFQFSINFIVSVWGHEEVGSEFNPLDFWIVLPLLRDLRGNLCLHFLFSALPLQKWAAQELPDSDDDLVTIRTNLE